MNNTRKHFIKQLNLLLVKRCGLGYEDLPDYRGCDLPDTVFIDDYYEEDLDETEFDSALKECASAIIEGADF